GGAERCQAAECAIIGGHTVRDTEIKFGYSVTGLVHPQKIFTNAAASPGDKLVLTKPLGTGCVTTAHKGQDCRKETLDAATGGMMICVPAAKAGELVAKCKANGCLTAAVIGEVREKQTASLVVRS